MRLDPYYLTLTDDLHGANDLVFRHRHHETHIAMLRKGRIGFQQYTADADVVADRVNPRNGLARSKLYLNGITYRETTVLALRLES
jgi:hypothetical protein